MMNQTQLINNLQNVLNMSKQIYKEQQRENCPYCLEEIEETNKTILPCGHQSHLKCLLTDMIMKESIDKVKCSFCREDIISYREKISIVNTRRQARIEENRRQQEELRIRQEEFNREIGQINTLPLLSSDSDDSSEDSNVERTLEMRATEEQRQRDERIRRQREREEQRTRYTQQYTTLVNNTRVNLLDGWRVRRNTCGYEILQTLLNSRNNTLQWRECKKIMSILKSSYTHETFRRNLNKLRDEGYLLYLGGGSFVENVKLSREFLIKNSE